MAFARVSLRSRATLALGAVAFAISLGVAVGSYELTRTTLIDQRQRTAERQTYLNARSVRAALAGGQGDTAAAISRVQVGTRGVALLRVGSEWSSTSVSAGSADIPPSLLASLDEGEPARQRVRGPNGMAVAVGVPLPEIGAAYVELISLEDVEDTLARVRQGLMLAVLAAAVFGSLSGRWLATRILRPVHSTAEAANDIREGTLDRRLHGSEDPDLRPLVESFNGMVDALQERVAREARFASDVTHELRSPLATMDAALSVARRRVKDEAAIEALDVLGQQVARFEALIIDLLDIARAEAGAVRLTIDEVEPGVLAEGLLRATNRDAVELVVEETAGRALLDKRRVGQALTNLLDNADNYGGGATRVTVSGDEHHVRYVIDDDGPGVPEHEREYVFERFARGSSSDAPGAGLGLALVAEHARLHGGSVTVGESPTGGARFTLELQREVS
jgi:signal transduction histidine kinase